MRTHRTENFIVYYSETEQDHIEALVDALQDRLDDLLSFFILEKLKKPANIIIYSDKNEFIRYILKYKDTYQDWIIGDTSDGNINMLSLHNCKMMQTHRDITLSWWIQVVVHELVHICQQTLNPNAYGCEWFWEALAINLSGQTMPLAAIDCTKEQLMFHYLSLPDGYSISYTIGKYMLEYYPHERLLEYVDNPQKLWDDTAAILEEVQNHHNI